MKLDKQECDTKQLEAYVPQGSVQETFEQTFQGLSLQSTSRCSSRRAIRKVEARDQKQHGPVLPMMIWLLSGLACAAAQAWRLKISRKRQNKMLLGCSKPFVDVGHWPQGNATHPQAWI